MISRIRIFWQGLVKSQRDPASQLKKRLGFARRYMKSTLTKVKRKQLTQVRVINRTPIKVSVPYEILIFKLDHIGDFITALEAFSLLRGNFHDATITLVCLPSIVELAIITELFDNVIGLDAIPESNKIGIQGQSVGPDLGVALSKIYAKQYWLAADFRHDPDTRRHLLNINATHKAGFLGNNDIPLTLCLPNMEWDVCAQALALQNLPQHNSDRLKLLASAIVNQLKTPTDVSGHFSTQQPQPIASQKVKIGVCIGAGAELKTWGQSYWLDLITKINKELSAFFIFFGGSEDAAKTRQLIESLPNLDHLNLVGELPLSETAGYLKQMRLYIGCDTGMTHFAAALNIPTLSLFSGVASLPVWQARGKTVETLYVDVPCSPCHLRFYSECTNSHECMQKLTPQNAWIAFKELYSAVES